MDQACVPTAAFATAIFRNDSRCALCQGEYDVGSTLGVEVSGTGELRFVTGRGRRVGGASLPPGKYVLCCQPYMGGAASIVASQPHSQSPAPRAYR